MKSKLYNFQLPPNAASRLTQVRADTGLSHATNLAWGMKLWVDNGCKIEGVDFSPESPSRQQKVLKLPVDAIQHLELLRKITQLPLWRIADGALHFCMLKRHPEALSEGRNPKLAEFTDAEIRIEATRRGYRVEEN